ncbi:MAG: branched-chain amino acid ABC transporter permease [Acidimicrobiia bacterium]
MKRSVKGALALSLVALAAFAPLLPFGIPWVFNGSISSPGTLQVLASALVLAGLAMSYDLLFGYTGLLSFGHALPFALGAYGTNLLMLHAGMNYGLAGLVTLIGVVAVSAVLGSVALRTTGVAFAMVTLAFAEAFSLLVVTDPLRFSGGEEGLALVSDRVPDLFRGVVNTRNIYWLALAFALFVFVATRRVVTSRAGRVFEAIRENEPRVEMLGLTPFRFKLSSFMISSGLAALGGSIYLLVVRGANVSITTAQFTLAILVMVVLGGAGKLWGAALGGFVYGILDLRLSAVATSETIKGLPGWLSGPLSEPLFVLGVIFVLLVLFAPGGLSSLGSTGRKVRRA